MVNIFVTKSSKIIASVIQNCGDTKFDTLAVCNDYYGQGACMYLIKCEVNLASVNAALIAPLDDRCNWGYHFHKLHTFLTGQDIMNVSLQNITSSSAWPIEDESYYDAKYKKWKVKPFDSIEARNTDSDTEWELVDINKENDFPSTNITESVVIHSLDIQEDKDSYKQILLKRQAEEEIQEIKEDYTRRHMKPWNPVIVTTHLEKRRIDRCAPCPSNVNYDDDGEGIWGLIDSNMIEKTTHCVNRVNSFTILRPSAQLKKDARIAAKGK